MRNFARIQFDPHTQFNDKERRESKEQKKQARFSCWKNRTAIEEEIDVERGIQEAAIALVDSSWHGWPGMRTKGVSGPLAWSAL